MNKELEKLYDRAIIGTIMNHPKNNMALALKTAIDEYIQSLITHKGKQSNNRVVNFAKYISNENKINHVKLRLPLIEYTNNNGIDIALGYLDLLFDNCIKLLNKDNLSSIQRLELFKYYFNYINIISPGSIDMGVVNNENIPIDNRLFIFNSFYEKYNNKFCVGNMYLNSIKNTIYNNCSILSELQSSVEKISELYIKSKDMNKVFDINTYVKDTSSISIKQVTKSAVKALSNVDDYKLVNSFSGVLLNGNITIASDRGYTKIPDKPQQDAVLSMVKNDNCFLNAIADGAGGTKNAQRASAYLINILKDWFNKYTEEDFKYKSMNSIVNELDILISKANIFIAENFPKSATTLVLALTLNGQTLIANVGDSTAYKYDANNDQLIQMSVLDSFSVGLSYEDARLNPFNNRITSSVGMGLDDVHYKIFNNDGSKIILSSDGVTDLVNERNFKNFFKNSTTASDIVKKAVFNPDVDERYSKKADNTSAIVISLPNDFGKKPKNRRI